MDDFNGMSGLPDKVFLAPAIRYGSAGLLLIGCDVIEQYASYYVV